ncbi:hypothetical protein ABE82_26405 (plasmid) [Paenibacillus peoriae]|uniref:hypothetical protein n=1 Tax=Paenibacillus peoriae TaxID=59893 RepID=UPI00072063D3|nr:hypothetical protein [Paenibacillus peoriae]ALS09949.1 hypothetical protein ABE82_26405 [Paenibacillus peoriae]
MKIEIEDLKTNQVYVGGKNNSLRRVLEIDHKNKSNPTSVWVIFETIKKDGTVGKQSEIWVYTFLEWVTGIAEGDHNGLSDTVNL